MKKNNRAGRAGINAVVAFLVADAYASSDGKKKVRDDADFADNNDNLESNFRAALKLAQKFGVRKETVGSIIVEYSRRSRTNNRLLRSVTLPSPSVMIGFARLNTSNESRELLLSVFTRMGLIGPAITLVRIIGRDFNERDVMALVNDYCSGAVSSERTETTLINLATETHMPKEFAKSVVEKLEARRRNWASEID